MYNLGMEFGPGDASELGRRRMAEVEAFKSLSRRQQKTMKDYRQKVDELETSYREKGYDIDSIFITAFKKTTGVSQWMN
jgi:hypothetical protein